MTTRPSLPVSSAALGGRVRDALGLALDTPDASGMVRVQVGPQRLVETCVQVAERLPAPLATMIGLDERAHTASFRLIYVFRASGGWIGVETLVPAASPRFPSVAARLPAAHWYEREVQDLLGVVAEGHPDPRRLVLHDDWPDGVHPLRKDFDPAQPVPRLDRPPQRLHHLHGEGIVEIPVGPIHAGVIEPGHFRFAAVGEVVLHLETRLFYTHRGIEKLAEGKSAERVLQIAERICGACSLSHAVSYSQAIEALARTSPPPRALALRTLFLELERLYNHVGDLGNVCAGTGFAVGASQGARLKDDLQRLNERLVGNRFLRGVVALGGVRRDLDIVSVEDARSTLARVEAEFGRFVELTSGSESYQERLLGTGTVSRQAAADFGAVGVAARASGLDRDVRRDHPYAGYGGIPVPVPVQREGDVRARVRQRIDETLASFAIAQQVLDALPAGPILSPLGPIPEYQSALGATESPRGENLHWVRSGPRGSIDRYRVRSASSCNWPVVALSVPGNMVPDFPVINKSFELCYSCLDR